MCVFEERYCLINGKECCNSVLMLTPKTIDYIFVMLLFELKEIKLVGDEVHSAKQIV